MEPDRWIDENIFRENEIVVVETCDVKLIEDVQHSIVTSISHVELTKFAKLQLKHLSHRNLNTVPTCLSFYIIL